jgi:hypothetical protein
MLRQKKPDRRPIAGFFVALTTAVLVLQLPHSQCPLRTGVDAYAPSVTVSACGVGVTLSL